MLSAPFCLGGADEVFEGACINSTEGTIDDVCDGKSREGLEEELEGASEEPEGASVVMTLMCNV